MDLDTRAPNFIELSLISCFKVEILKEVMVPVENQFMDNPPDEKNLYNSSKTWQPRELSNLAEPQTSKCSLAWDCLCYKLLFMLFLYRSARSHVTFDLL